MKNRECTPKGIKTDEVELGENLKNKDYTPKGIKTDVVELE